MEEPFIITVLHDMVDVSKLVNMYFKDENKTTKWLNTKNPMLGNTEPMQMVFANRTDKLKDFIKQQLEGNSP